MLCLIKYLTKVIEFSRPGILVLINDADWELDEKEESILHNDDRLSFISTLHGG